MTVFRGYPTINYQGPQCPGMSIRTRIASEQMPALLSDDDQTPYPELASDAVEAADALIAALNKE